METCNMKAGTQKLRTWQKRKKRLRSDATEKQVSKNKGTKEGGKGKNGPNRDIRLETGIKI